MTTTKNTTSGVSTSTRLHWVCSKIEHSAPSLIIQNLYCENIKTPRNFGCLILMTWEKHKLQDENKSEYIDEWMHFFTLTAKQF